MSNLDNIIADIKEVNQTYDFWIRDKDGNIKDDVICAEIIPFLEELKDYELDMTQEEIENFPSEISPATPEYADVALYDRHLDRPEGLRMNDSGA